jgi:hypothetical protein
LDDLIKSKYKASDFLDWYEQQQLFRTDRKVFWK